MLLYSVSFPAVKSIATTTTVAVKMQDFIPTSPTVIGLCEAKTVTKVSELRFSQYHTHGYLRTVGILKSL